MLLKHTVHFSTSQSARPPFRVPTKAWSSTSENLGGKNCSVQNEKQLISSLSLKENYKNLPKPANTCNCVLCGGTNFRSVNATKSSPVRSMFCMHPSTRPPFPLKSCTLEQHDLDHKQFFLDHS